MERVKPVEKIDEEKPWMSIITAGHRRALEKAGRISRDNFHSCIVECPLLKTNGHLPHRR